MWELFIQTFQKIIYKPAPEPDFSSNMLVTANAFTKACEIFGYKYSHDKKTMPIIPMITNMAFSCELYLKFLLEKNMITQPTGNDGHNFEVLIDKLPENIKVELIDKIASSYKEINQTNFKEKLEPIKKCFSNWRYIHEAKLEKDIDLKLLVNLMLKLQEICNERQNK